MLQTEKPYRKLWRSRRDKMIAGVCGGLARYWNIDPFWIRFSFVLVFLLGGAAFFIYIIMWFIIPLEPLD